MQESVKQLLGELAQQSYAGKIHFGQVVASLTLAGVESYQADFRSHGTTYFMPDGSHHTLALETPQVAIADQFDAGTVVAAIRGAQRGEVMYPAFVQMVMAAGCIGYIVWLAGRHVTYFGRRGEMHIEHFPAAQ